MEELTIKAASGLARAYLLRAPQPDRPGVVLFMDVFGIRPALMTVGSRLASLGYNVLVPDLYYRLGPYGPYPADKTLADPARLAKVREMRDSTPITATVADVPHFVAAMRAQDIKGPLGFVGYCMGGGRALRAAAAVPDDVSLVAAIHAGRLAIDDAESPHRHLGALRSRVYLACAGVDDSFPPEQSAQMAQTMREAGIDHLIENYVGCEHGWAIPDNPIFDEAGAERAWNRLNMLLHESIS